MCPIKAFTVHYVDVGSHIQIFLLTLDISMLLVSLFEFTEKEEKSANRVKNVQRFTPNRPLKALVSTSLACVENPCTTRSRNLGNNS